MMTRLVVSDYESCQFHQAYERHVDVVIIDREAAVLDNQKRKG